MESNYIPKKYMLILQKRNGGQDAVTFNYDGSMKLIRIEPFTDKEFSETPKKKNSISKNTLAFYDTITSRFRNLFHFLSLSDEIIYPYEYNDYNSYVGFLNNKHMSTLTIAFNDPLLAHIASKVNGNQINKEDTITINEIDEIINLVEDNDSDFVDKLIETHKNKDKRYSFSNSLINTINSYHNTKRLRDFNNLHSMRINETLEEDLQLFKKELLSKIESYKVFRELYRFKKHYLTIKGNNQLVSPVEEKPPQVDDELFGKLYEEAKCRTYQKTKKIDNQIPGQTSLFD